MCEHPILLVNPSALKLYQKAEYFMINGNKYYNLSFAKIKQLVGYYEKGKRVTDPENIYHIVENSYYVIENVRCNLFIAAPCRNCVYCKESKRREYEGRALFEAAQNPFMYFFTLTYNNYSCPDSGLCPRHVSSFLKRFRENLAKAYSEKFDCDLSSARSATQFRCIYVGEYGVDPRYTRRPHYHGIFFFKHPIPDKYIPWLYSIFKKSWYYGVIDDFQKVHTPAAAARYVTKYITKQDLSHVPEGKNPCFIRGPHKCGLGAQNLGYYLDDILKSKDGTIQLNIAGSVVRVTIPKFILEKIFPTFSRVYGSVQDCFWNFHQCVMTMKARRAWDPFTHCLDPDKYIDIYKRVAYLELGSRQQYSKQQRIDMECGEISHIPGRFLEKVVRSYSDERINKVFLWCISVMSNLPSEDEFFMQFKPKIEWQSNLQIPRLTYSEKLEKKTAQLEANLNYVKKRMLNDNFDEKCLVL